MRDDPNDLEYDRREYHRAEIGSGSVVTVQRGGAKHFVDVLLTRGFVFQQRRVEGQCLAEGQRVVAKQQTHNGLQGGGLRM